MSLGLEHSLPRWLIDDTADLANARLFCVHTQEPRLIGELLPEDEAELTGVEIAGLPDHQVLTRIVWIDPPEFSADELTRSLIEAIHLHGSIRWDI